jgi:hypothetical protein
MGETEEPKQNNAISQMLHDEEKNYENEKVRKNRSIC